MTELGPVLAQEGPGRTESGKSATSHFLTESGKKRHFSPSDGIGPREAQKRVIEPREAQKRIIGPGLPEVTESGPGCQK